MLFVVRSPLRTAFMLMSMRQSKKERRIHKAQTWLITFEVNLDNTKASGGLKSTFSSNFVIRIYFFLVLLAYKRWDLIGSVSEVYSTSTKKRHKIFHKITVLLSSLNLSLLRARSLIGDYFNKIKLQKLIGSVRWNSQ